MVPAPESSENAPANAEIALPDFTNDELRSISTLDDIVTLVGGPVVNAMDELGNGFAIMEKEQKDRLCGVPIVILAATVNVGDHGLFVSAYVVELNKQGSVVGKWIVNDGSMKSGMGAQLKEYIDTKGAIRGMFVPNGLRRSDYTWIDESDGGKEKPATTYYIDLSA